MNPGGNRSNPPRRKRRVTDKPAAAPGPAAPKPARPERAERPATPAQALERLRARVGDAVRELERLRTENELLAQRVHDLERDGGRAPELLLPFGETPEAMRQKMDEFIDVLDAFLASDSPVDASLAATDSPGAPGAPLSDSSDAAGAPDAASPAAAAANAAAS